MLTTDREGAPWEVCPCGADWPSATAEFVFVCAGHCGGAICEECGVQIEDPNDLLFCEDCGDEARKEINGELCGELQQRGETRGHDRLGRRSWINKEAPDADD